MAKWIRHLLIPLKNYRRKAIKILVNNDQMGNSKIYKKFEEQVLKSFEVI